MTNFECNPSFMTTGILHSHYLCVILFTLIYLVKIILLLSDKDELLEKFRRKTRITEMVVSFGFLATGIYLLMQLPFVSPLMVIKIVLVVLAIPLAVIGYRNKNKLLATLSFFVIVVSFGLSHKAKDSKAGGKISAVNGREIFEDKCALCHGNNGKLGINGAKDLSVTQMNHAGIIETITNGKNSMAAYKSVLTPEQIDAVASYIESDIKGK